MMTVKSARQYWRDICDVVPSIREQHGLAAALNYVVGEKLMMFAHTAETEEGFRAELPSFCARIRVLFSKEEIQQHFESVERGSLVEANLFEDISPEEAEELTEVL